MERRRYGAVRQLTCEIKNKADNYTIGWKNDHSCQSLYEQCALRQLKHIEYELLPSGRCSPNRFKNSFVPASVRILTSLNDCYTSIYLANTVISFQFNRDVKRENV